MKIGIIADIHLDPLPVPEKGQKPELDEKRKKLNEFYEKAREFDFVVNLGDLLSGTGDEDKDYATAYMFSRSMINSTVNTYYVLGNHDTTDIPRDLLLHCTEKLGGAYTFTADDVLFIALDANYTSDGQPYKAGSDWTDANVSENQLVFLKETLDASPCTSVVILCHQRLDLFMNEFEMLNPHVVSNSGKVREILENSGKKVLVLQAHFHKGDDVRHNGIRYYTQTAFIKNETANYSVLTVENGKFNIEKASV